jgi:transcriptional regulator with GAF, ATPase, and Fis domain
VRQVEVVAPTAATVRHPHRARREHACIPVHCAAIPAGWWESELFGHERGADVAVHAAGRDL